MTATVSPAAGTMSLASSSPVTFSTCLPLRVLATSSSSATTKPLPVLEAMSALRAWPVDEEIDEVLPLFDIDHQPQRLALAAPAGQLVGRQRIDLAAGREQQQLVGGLAPAQQL